MNSRIQIFVNGEARTVARGFTIVELLAQLGLKEEQVAVEVNREIVRRDSWRETSLEDDDRIEIVHFVGGGGL